MMHAAINPFSTARVERLLDFDPGLIGTCWDTIDERWAELGWRACVTGHHGAGKTTFLETMATRLKPRARVELLFFNDRKRSLSPEDRKVLERCEGAFLLIDGDESLSWSDRRSLARQSRRARGCLFARHRQRGLPELLRLRSNPELARQLLERISPEWRRKLDGELEQKLREMDGNLRELWLGCFDLAGK
jgi:energy-coupling factor transporter ATP-binding protein EcfA2